MSFQIDVDPKEEAGTRTIMKIVREIRRAFLEEQRDERLTQQQIATKLGVNRSVVNRRLLGRENMTLRSIGELMWAMDRDWVISSSKARTSNDRMIETVTDLAPVARNQGSPNTASVPPIAVNRAGMHFEFAAASE